MLDAPTCSIYFLCKTTLYSPAFRKTSRVWFGNQEAPIRSAIRTVRPYMPNDNKGYVDC